MKTSRKFKPLIAMLRALPELSPEAVRVMREIERRQRDRMERFVRGGGKR